jgi:streptogrisin C
MNRTLAGAAAAAILLPAGIVAVMIAAPAVADDEPPGPPPPPPSAPAADAASPEMLAAMQRDLGLTAKGARERIARDSAAGRTGLALRKKLGSAYGGAWLTADANLVVAVTDSDMADEVTAAGATPKLVDLSAANLDALKADLDASAAKAPAASVPGWYIDSKTNTVVVQARGNTAAARAFIRASGVDTDAVRVVRTSERPKTLANVRGGDAYFIGENGNDSCSVGFSVNGGFVSAGHCGKAGAKTVASETSGKKEFVELGEFQGSSYPGDDYAWVKVTDEWTPQPWVNDGDGGNVVVAGSTAAAVGAVVCRSGANSGWRCGTILALDQTVNYKDKGSVSGLTRTNACAEAGDSGGSFLSGQQAQGVLSGGSGNCSAGGLTYFQPVNEILSAYNLTLVTSDGNPRPTNPSSGGVCRDFGVSATGSLTESSMVYVPARSYYYSSSTGTHGACLDGPAGTDFNLHLEKWSGTAWTVVASAESGDEDEIVTYKGGSGYYTWRVTAGKGAGTYTLGYNHP